MSKEEQTMQPQVIAYDSDTEQQPIPESSAINLEIEDKQLVIVKTDEVPKQPNPTNDDLWVGIGPEEQAHLQELQRSMQEKETPNNGHINDTGMTTTDTAVTAASNRTGKDALSLDSSSIQYESQQDNPATTAVAPTTKKLARRKAPLPAKKGGNRTSSKDTTSIATPISSTHHRPIAPNDGCSRISPIPALPNQEQEQSQSSSSIITVLPASDETSTSTSQPSSSSQPQQAAARRPSQPIQPSRHQAILDKDKPVVGTDEWHRQRRENHKQVERRRREAINDGINEIAKMVPGAERNKGSILQRAAAYIKQLKDAEAATIEKWTLEKLLTDQAINELNRQIDSLRAELEKAKIEKAVLKKEVEMLRDQHQEKQKERRVVDLDDDDEETTTTDHTNENKKKRRMDSDETTDLYNNENRRKRRLSSSMYQEGVEDGEDVMATVISALQQQAKDGIGKCKLV